MSFNEIAQMLGSLGGFFGAIAVVGTLIYLARQVKQNTASVQANGYQTWVSSNLQLNLATMSQRFSETAGKGIYDSKALESDTFFMFALWNHSVFQMIQATDYMYRLGAIDEALWESEISRAAIHLGLPGVRQWWDAGGRTQLAPHFADLIENYESKTTRWSWNPDEGFVPDSADSDDEPELGEGAP